MARMSLVFTLGLAAGVCLVAGAAAQAPAPAAPAVDSLIAANLAAKGGLARLRDVRSIRQVSRVMVAGLTAEVVQTASRPDLIRQDLTAGSQTIVTAFDGTTAWTINPLTGSSEPTILDGPIAEMLRAQAAFDSPLLDHAARGYAVVLVGTAEISGSSVYHLRVTTPAGIVQQTYLDPATMLERRIVTQGPSWTVTQDLTDYRTVDGLTLPFAMTTTIDGQDAGRIVVSRIDVDPEVDAGLFRMPSGN